MNNYCDTVDGNKVTSLFAFHAMINHGKANIFIDNKWPSLKVTFASRDIDKGEQLTYDYLPGLDGEEKKKVLKEAYRIKVLSFDAQTQSVYYMY